MSNVKRQKKPTLRQRQAEATRNLILSAAQDLFSDRGYAGTTIEAIAEHAGVAVSTVYAVYGSKRSLLRAIRLAWHERSQIRDVAYSAPDDTEAKDRLEQLALATRQQWEMGSEVIAIYTGAASADPEAAAELQEAIEGRRKGMRAFAASIQPSLREDLDEEKAADILQALCLPEVYYELVKHAGWAPETYQAWLAQALKRELLRAGC